MSSYRGMLRSVREGVFFWKTDFDYDISIQSQLLVNIRFMCHVHEARDLREMRICIINTALEKNQSSINQHRIRITIQ